MSKIEPNKPAPKVVNATNAKTAEEKQAFLEARARAKNQQKQVYDGVPEFETTGMPESDWTPLDDMKFSDDFVDDFAGNFEDNPFHSVDDLLVPSHIDDVIPSGDRLAVVDQIGAELSPFRRRALSAVEQTMDLVAQVSHDAKTGTVGNTIQNANTAIKKRNYFS